MSNDVMAAKRGPGSFRAAICTAFGCLLLGGCSSGSDRFSTFSFGSGYEGGPSAEAASVPAASSTYKSPAQSASYRPQTNSSSFQLASANASQSGGYLQVSRVDLPPLPQTPQATGAGTKYADGYGRYGPAPLPDGTYAGPRVYVPYGQPQEAPPPAAGSYDNGDASGYARGEDRDAARERDLRQPSSGTTVYEPKSQARIYEQEPNRNYRDDAAGQKRDYEYRDNASGHSGDYADRDTALGRWREEGRAPERQSYYNPQHSENTPPTSVGRSSDPVAQDRGPGQVVTVRHGETLYAIAQRYGVSVNAIMRANDLSSMKIRPGTDLLIPRPSPAAYRPDEGRAVAQPATCAGIRCHVVRRGETVDSIARDYGMTAAELASANNLNGHAPVPGQAIIIPQKIQPSRQVAASNETARPEMPAAQSKSLAPSQQAANEQSTMASGPAPKAPEPKAEPTCEAALANPAPRSAVGTFRKPVDGKTIAEFGPQRDGTVNEGITISVPLGTPIKAAENGVVAYVGDELPGFGNLILVRHAGDYVTAYAHTDKILVKKCDSVKRGQTIATAGTTGDVSQPELHFEIRKNQKPVDPAPLLGS